MIPKLNSFITGFAIAALISGALFAFNSSRRSHHAADEMITALEDPRLKERYLRAVGEMQKDSLALKLQSLATRAVFSERLIALRTDHNVVLQYQIAAISEFLDSEGDWMANHVTFDMVAPIFKSIKLRIDNFLSANPDIAQMLEAHRKAEKK